MMPRGLVSKRAIVLLTEGTDKIIIDIDAETAFPKSLSSPSGCDLPYVTMDAQADYGAKWVQSVLGLEPEVINTRKAREVCFRTTGYSIK
jgi:hypothetical protein